MSIREISFPSANGRDTIKAWSYSPLGQPKAIVQLIHGYGELSAHDQQVQRSRLCSVC